MNNNMNNQFFDMMKSYMNPEMFTSCTKGMSTMDFSSFSSMLKNNAELISSTNQMAAESAQSILRRGAEIFQNNASGMFNAFKDVASFNDMEHATACGQKYLRNSFEDSMSNAQEIMDMASKSSMEIFQAVGKGISENMNKMFDNKSAHNHKGKKDEN
jgi:hypothetical protein